MPDKISLTTAIESAAKLPLVHVDRSKFLTKNLHRICSEQQMQEVLEKGPVQAKIPVGIIDSIANKVINNETIKVTAISTGAGIPGGFAMIGTIPADLAQFTGFTIRIAQELAYLYGWHELVLDRESLDAGTESQLILFIGVMYGVAAARTVVGKLFGEVAAVSVAKKVAQKALTKTWYYPIVKKIANYLGVKMTKELFGKGIGKVIPIAGGVISGGLTLASFKPMANRLKKHLSELARMSPEEYAKYEASLVIDESALDKEIEEIPDLEEITDEDIDTNVWICECGTENKGKFCADCGHEKPKGIPQYRCDKCGWEPDDVTKPPKFCPVCGDPFDDADIVDDEE